MALHDASIVAGRGSTRAACGIDGPGHMSAPNQSHGHTASIGAAHSKNGAVKEIDTDVQLLLKWLREKIGTTYAQATANNDDNLLGLDLSRWGGDRSALQRRVGAPRRQRERRWPTTGSTCGTR